jgi:hypothetical protein
MFTMDIQTLINVLSEIYDNKENYDIMKFHAAVNQHRIIIRSYINIDLYCEFQLEMEALGYEGMFSTNGEYNVTVLNNCIVMLKRVIDALMEIEASS